MPDRIHPERWRRESVTTEWKGISAFTDIARLDIILFLFQIVDVERRTTGGFARGVVMIQDCEDEHIRLKIDFQNENLIATLTENGKGIKMFIRLQSPR